jgi:hypothetical protein
VGERSRGRFATPADFPRQDCTLYRGLHVPRWGLGFVHRSTAIFCRAVPNPSVTIRSFFIAERARCVLTGSLPVADTREGASGRSPSRRCLRNHRSPRAPQWGCPTRLPGRRPRLPGCPARRLRRRRRRGCRRRRRGPRRRHRRRVSFLGDANISLGDAKSSLGDTLRARWVTLSSRWVTRYELAG